MYLRVFQISLRRHKTKQKTKPKISFSLIPIDKSLIGLTQYKPLWEALLKMSVGKYYVSRDTYILTKFKVLVKKRVLSLSKKRVGRNHIDEILGIIS